MLRSCSRWLLCAAGLASSFVARAGGHFDVDDATALAPGRCQIETWFARTPSVSGRLFHVGPGCRAGPIELSAGFDQSRAEGETAGTFSPQIKWVTDRWLDRVAAGVVASAAIDLRHGGRPICTLYVPVTLTLGGSLLLHLNAGADQGQPDGRTKRLGAAAEWAATRSLSLIGERVEVYGMHTSRFGAHFGLGTSTSLDLSAANVGSPAERIYTLGLNHEFGR